MTWRPIAPEELADRVATWLAATPGIVRVAVDGAPAGAPVEVAESLIEPLALLGRAAVVVRADRFWRDASLRLEPGRQDVESYRSWLDDGALRREVLEPAVSAGRYLPSLRDPVTNRSTRERPRSLAAGAIVVVAGSLLLGRGLPFDRTVHLTLSPPALAQRTDQQDAWTLPAYTAYEDDVRPSEVADVVVRVDRRPPAVRGLS
jgi:hypothetical protein